MAEKGRMAMKSSVLPVVIILFLVLLVASTAIAETEIKLGDHTLHGDELSFSVAEYNFVDEYSSARDLGISHGRKSSGNTYQFLIVEVPFLNESLSEITLAKLKPSAYLTYSEKYSFDGIIKFRDLNRSNQCAIEADFAIGVLEEGQMCVIFEVPNIVENSKNELVFHMLIGEEEYVVNIR